MSRERGINYPALVINSVTVALLSTSAIGDGAFAASHVQADRGLMTAQIHAFVARDNVLELEKQAADGVDLELRKPPKEASCS